MRWGRFMLLDRFFKLNVGARRGLLPDVAVGTSIPRIIHQTYKSADFPDGIEGNIANLLELNPGWEHRFYDNNAVLDFIHKEYGDKIVEYYLRISPEYGAARADFFRYLVMYRIGGVYLDIKSSAKLPFDTVLRPDDTFLLATWPQDDPQFTSWGAYPELAAIGGFEYEQWHIIAAPGHPFLREVIERVLYNIDHYIPELHGTGAYANMRVTAPVAYTLGITAIFDRADKRVVGTHDEIGLVYSIYDSPLQHRSLLSQHYNKLTTPMVVLKAPQKQISYAIRTCRRIVRVFA
jgi:hypothetical protein